MINKKSGTKQSDYYKPRQTNQSLIRQHNPTTDKFGDVYTCTCRQRIGTIPKRVKSGVPGKVNIARPHVAIRYVNYVIQVYF